MMRWAIAAFVIGAVSSFVLLWLLWQALDVLWP
jgi:hypothetical protein